MQFIKNIINSAHSGVESLFNAVTSKANSRLQLGIIYVGYLALALTLLPTLIAKPSLALFFKALPIALSMGISPAALLWGTFIPVAGIVVWGHITLIDALETAIFKRFKEISIAQQILAEKEAKFAWSKLANDKDGFWNGVSPANKQLMQSNPKFCCSLTGEVMRNPVFVTTSTGERCYFDYLNLLEDYKVNTEVDFMHTIFGISPQYIPLATREPLELSAIQHDYELKAEIDAAKGFSIWNTPHYLTLGYNAACAKAASFRSLLSSCGSTTAKPSQSATETVKSLGKGIGTFSV